LQCEHTYKGEYACTNSAPRLDYAAVYNEIRLEV